MSIQFWKDKAGGIVEPSLFASVAEEKAKKISTENDHGKLNKSTQLRKFYDEIISFRQRLQECPEDFAAIHPYIQMVKAKVAYAKGRNLVSEGYRQMLNECIDQVARVEDFMVMASFLEAFMGYYKLYNPKEN